MPGNAGEYYCGQCFDGRITRGYMYAAIAAASAENQITDYRKVVIRLNGGVALWASRIWKNDRLFARDSVYDYVEEAANDCPDYAEERAYNWQRHIKGAIYRRHDHPKALYRGCDPLPTDFSTDADGTD